MDKLLIILTTFISRPKRERNTLNITHTSVLLRCILAIDTSLRAPQKFSLTLCLLSIVYPSAFFRTPGGLRALTVYA